MGGSRKTLFRATLLLLLCGIIGSNGDLTGQLVDESRTVANVLGPRQAEVLVESQLDKVKSRREEDADRARTAKQIAAQRYHELQDSEARAARLDSKERELKERLNIELDREQSQRKVADKADGIAHKMQQLANQADQEWEAAKKALSGTSFTYKDVKQKAAAAAADAEEKEKRRRAAEEEAAIATKKLAVLDHSMQGLLAKKTRLENMATAEDDRSSTRLAEAFRMDEGRQKRFKQALANERDRERHQREQRAKDKEASKQAMLARVERKASEQQSSADIQIESIEKVEDKLLQGSPALKKLAERQGIVTNDGSAGNEDDASSSTSQSLHGGNDSLDSRGTFAWFRGSKGGGREDRDTRRVDADDDFVMKSSRSGWRRNS